MPVVGTRTRYRDLVPRVLERPRQAARLAAARVLVVDEAVEELLLREELAEGLGRSRLEAEGAPRFADVENEEEVLEHDQILVALLDVVQVLLVLRLRGGPPGNLRARFRAEIARGVPEALREVFVHLLIEPALAEPVEDDQVEELHGLLHVEDLLVRAQVRLHLEAEVGVDALELDEQRALELHVVLLDRDVRVHLHDLPGVEAEIPEPRKYLQLPHALELVHELVQDALLPDLRLRRDLEDELLLGRGLLLRAQPRRGLVPVPPGGPAQVLAAPQSPRAPRAQAEPPTLAPRGLEPRDAFRAEPAPPALDQRGGLQPPLLLGDLVDAFRDRLLRDEAVPGGDLVLRVRALLRGSALQGAPHQAPGVLDVRVRELRDGVLLPQELLLGVLGVLGLLGLGELILVRGLEELRERVGLELPLVVELIDREY